MAPLSTILASAATASIMGRDFSYHDNNVIFQGHVGTYLGGFHVTDLSISAGQDPQGKNHVGDNHPMTEIVWYSNGWEAIVGIGSETTHRSEGLTFSVGRHKTAAVGTFWNTQVPPSKNTFGHTAGDLNFAFIGNLFIQIGNNQETFFPDIGLAQGSDSNGNNWWFGGKNCTNTGSNHVRCNGFDGVNRPIYGDFTRGGKGLINEVYFDAWGFL